MLDLAGGFIGIKNAEALSIPDEALVGREPCGPELGPRGRITAAQFIRFDAQAHLTAYQYASYHSNGTTGMFIRLCGAVGLAGEQPQT